MQPPATSGGLTRGKWPTIFDGLAGCSTCAWMGSQTVRQAGLSSISGSTRLGMPDRPCSRSAFGKDLVFAVREVMVDVSDLGIAPFSVAALAQVELVAEKLRTLVQRGQPRDLFDLHLYLVESGWHLNPVELKRAVDAKLALTRRRRWRPGLWKLNLEAIEGLGRGDGCVD